MARHPGDVNLNDREKRMAAEKEAALLRQQAERKKREAAEHRARELAKRIPKS
jgi:hypothetical protein